MIRGYFALVFSLISAAHATAAPLIFEIDPTQSYLRISLETLTGDKFSSPQTPDSDVTSIFGTLQIEVTDTSLRFLSSSEIHFTNQNEPQAPLVDGSTGASTAAFGLSLSLPPLITGVVAGRDYVADAVSMPIDRVGATFDARQVLLNITSGVTSYNVTMLGQLVSGSTEAIDDAPNENLAGILVLDQGKYMMLMPVTVHGETAIDNVSIAIVYQGLLVATHAIAVPEPSSLTLAAWGGIVALLAGFQRRKR